MFEGEFFWGFFGDSGGRETYSRSRGNVMIFGQLKVNGTLEVGGDLKVWGALTLDGYL